MFKNIANRNYNFTLGQKCSPRKDDAPEFTETDFSCILFQLLPWSPLSRLSLYVRRHYRLLYRDTYRLMASISTNAGW